MAITFYFDPMCPFTWRTSRWVKDVAGRTGETVTWKFLSLATLNEGKFPQYIGQRERDRRNEPRPDIGEAGVGRSGGGLRHGVSFLVTKGGLREGGRLSTPCRAEQPRPRAPPVQPCGLNSPEGVILRSEPRRRNLEGEAGQTAPVAWFAARASP